MNLGSKYRKHYFSKLSNENKSLYGRKLDFFIKDDKNNVFLLVEVASPPCKKKLKKEIFDYGHNHHNGKDEFEYCNLSIIYNYGPSLTKKHIKDLMKSVNILLLQIHGK